MQTPNTYGQPKKDIKLYTTGWVGFATYVGGPLAGAFLMSKNFKELGQEDHAANTLKIGVVATLLIFGGLVLVPEAVLDKLPNSLLPIVYTAVIYKFMVQYQEKDIEKHLKEKGAKQSGWKATGIAILALLISMAYFFGLFMILPESMLR
jgi:hypothetical protein